MAKKKSIKTEEIVDAQIVESKQEPKKVSVELSDMQHLINYIESNPSYKEAIQIQGILIKIVQEANK